MANHPAYPSDPLEWAAYIAAETQVSAPTLNELAPGQDPADRDAQVQLALDAWYALILRLRGAAIAALTSAGRDVPKHRGKLPPELERQREVLSVVAELARVVVVPTAELEARLRSAVGLLGPRSARPEALAWVLHWARRPDSGGYGEPVGEGYALAQADVLRYLETGAAPPATDPRAGFPGTPEPGGPGIPPASPEAEPPPAGDEEPDLPRIKAAGELELANQIVQAGLRTLWTAGLDGKIATVARCKDHGLHGQRETCFDCGEVAEQVPVVLLETLTGPKRSSIEDLPDEAAGALADFMVADGELRGVGAHEHFKATRPSAGVVVTHDELAEMSEADWAKAREVLIEKLEEAPGARAVISTERDGASPIRPEYLKGAEAFVTEGGPDVDSRYRVWTVDPETRTVGIAFEDQGGPTDGLRVLEVALPSEVALGFAKAIEDHATGRPADGTT